jgi:hypothetical protein
MIAMKADSFTCPKCARTSHNPMDVHEQYCGACHEWFNEYGPRYFDRSGNPISLRKWADLWEDVAYRQVADTYVGRTRVSTIWLGLDHGFYGDARLIFETMVFGRYGELGQWRWSTEKEATAWHDMVVQSLRAKSPRKIKKRLLQLRYGGALGYMRHRSYFRVRSPYLRPFSNPRKLSVPGRLVSRKYHARKTRRVRR